MKKAIASYFILAFFAAIIALYPKVFPITGAEMDYCVIGYILIFPLVSIICGFLSGWSGIVYGLLSTFISALGSLIMPLIVFGATGREYMLLPVVGSILGIAASSPVKKIVTRNKEENK